MMTTIAICIFWVGLLLILIGFLNSSRFEWNTIVILIVCGGLLAGFSVLYGLHKWIEYEREQPVEELAIKPRKATYEGHSYLVFRWNVIHDPNCACRHPFNHKTIKKP